MSETKVYWLPGWYCTRLHASTKVPVDKYETALCGECVYATPQTEWAQRRFDRGVPHCKHCERILRKMRAENEERT